MIVGVDLTGMRFGKLMVVRATEHSKGDFAVWECKCDCGKTVLVSEDCLVEGVVTACNIHCKGYGATKGRKIAAKKQLTAVSRKRNELAVGQRFGRLTTVRFVGEVDKYSTGRKAVMWECKCDCGNHTLVSQYSLAAGNTKSCGCLKKDRYGRGIKDLTGMRFGKLTALRPTDRRETGYVVWECRCDCGKIIFAGKERLERGRIKSCGCGEAGAK